MLVLRFLITGHRFVLTVGLKNCGMIFQYQVEFYKRHFALIVKKVLFLTPVSDFGDDHEKATT